MPKLCAIAASPATLEPASPATLRPDWARPQVRAKLLSQNRYGWSNLKLFCCFGRQDRSHRQAYSTCAAWGGVLWAPTWVVYVHVVCKSNFLQTPWFCNVRPVCILCAMCIACGPYVHSMCTLCASSVRPMCALCATYVHGIYVHRLGGSLCECIKSRVLQTLYVCQFVTMSL